MRVISASLVTDFDVTLVGLNLMDVDDVDQDLRRLAVVLVQHKEIILDILIVGQVHDEKLHVSDGALNGL